MGDDETIVPIDPDLAPGDPAEPASARRPPPARGRTTRAQPGVLAAIALGGALGASARLAIVRAVPPEPGRFPWATFGIDVAGSFALGFLLIVLLERFPPTRYLRPFLATGVIGAFTTMSTYLVETAVLIQHGHVTTAVSYGVGTLLAGLLCAAAGITLARRTARPGAAAGRPRREAR